jgi:hypothetical protein
MGLADLIDKGGGRKTTEKKTFSCIIFINRTAQHCPVDSVPLHVKRIESRVQTVYRESGTRKGIGGTWLDCPLAISQTGLARTVRPAVH